MRRNLLILFLLAVAAGLAWLFLLQTPPPAAPTGERAAAAPSPGLDPARAEAAGGGRDLIRAPDLAPYDNRPVKVGAGIHGLHGTVVDEDEEPVPGAWVGAYSVPFPLLDFEFEIAEIFEQPLDFDLEPLAAVFADERGRFALEGLQGRTLYLTARTEKRLSPRRQRVLPSALDAPEGILLRTVAAAALEGRVTGADGAPVAGAEVLIGPGLKYLIAAFRNRNFFLERVYSDGNGAFRIEAVPAGIVLTANAFANAVESGLSEFGPLARGADGQVNVRLGDTGGLSGLVKSLDGEAVSGAAVVAVPLDLRYVIPFIRDPGAWLANTDGAGRYHFERLPQALVLLLAQGRAGRSAPLMSRVTGAGSLAPDLVLDVRLDLRGRVVDGAGRPVANALVQLQSIPGGEEQRDPSRTFNQPGGLIFEAARQILPELLPESAAIRSGADGRFRVPAWSTAKLRVSATGYVQADFDLGELEEGKAPVLQIWKPGAIAGRVTEYDGSTPVPFYLVRGDLAGGPSATAVAPAALDEGESLEEMAPALPRPEWLVEDEQVLAQEASWRARLVATRLIDAADGRFRLEQVPPGSWRLTVQADGFENSVETGVMVEEGKTTDEVRIQIGRGASIAGRVLGASRREPIAGAVVSAGEGEESGFMAMLQGLGDSVAMGESGPDGSFLLRGVPAGADHVNVAADGYAAGSLAIPPVAEGEQRERIEVLVADGGTLTGLVHDRHQRPLPGRMVGALSLVAKDFQQTAADGEGRYRMEHMRAGSYFVFAADLEDESLFAGDLMTMLGSSRITTAFIKEGEITELDLLDPAAGGCRLEGELRDGVTPVPGANLALFSAEGSGLLGLNFGFSTARTGEDGRFLFKSVAPGEYRVQIESPVWRGSLPLEVYDQPEDFVVLEVPSSGVSGQVVSAQSGAPVDGASVMLIAEDPAPGGFAAIFGTSAAERKRERTGADGSYEFRGIAPGRYRLEVAPAGGSFRARPDAAPAGPPLGRAVVPAFALLEGERKMLDPVRLPLAGAIHVRATLAGGGEPERWFTARARREGAAEESADGPDAFFGGGLSAWGQSEALITGVEEGRYEVVIGGSDYLETVVPGIEVRAGETAEVQATLTRGVRLRVRVLDAANNPVSGADIALLDDRGKRLNESSADFGAVFERMFGSAEVDLGIHPPGYYTVRVNHEGRSAEQAVTLVEGAPATTVEVRL